MGLHQTKKLPHNKGNHHQNEKQPIKQEKIFANDIFDKRLIYKIYKEFLPPNNEKTSSTI